MPNTPRFTSRNRLGTTLLSLVHRMRDYRFLTVCLAFILAIISASNLLRYAVKANSTGQTLPFSQNWTNTALITTNDDWSGVPGIEGFLGQDLTTATATDPQTLLGTSSIANDLDVIANQTNPNTLSAGGVGEFHSTIQAPPDNTNPTIALNGSGTADAPNIILYLNATGQSNINVSYNLRDLDCSIDNAVQQVALQYRVGGAGNFTNLPAGYVSDATTGPSLCTAVTPVSVTLPAAAANQSNVQVRIISTNAVGNDEWVGVDDISVTSSGLPSLSINNVSQSEGDSGTTTYTFTVSLSSIATSDVTFDIATADGTAQDDNPVAEDNDYVGKSEIGRTITTGNSSTTFTVDVNGDTNFESNENFFVNITNVSGAVLTDGQGLGTITNDDCPTPAADIVISQVYGGGGNAGAPLQSDFIELYNRGTTTVSLAGWSVQYTSAAGAGTWDMTLLTGSIAPGGYYLIQEASGNSCSGSPCGVPLPAADQIGTIPMGSGAGKVALFSSTTATTGSCPTCPVDMVGYGGANCFEGSGPTGSTSNTTAAVRKRGGCFDSNNNAADFSIGSPNPRNSSNSRTCDYIAAAIHDIQGSGLTTPFLGQDMSTTGIVTAKKSNGFFIQETDAGVDVNPDTSEGIFVFTSTAPAVLLGDAVSIKGTASEFFNLTQLESTLPGDVTVNTSGNLLPSTVTLTTTLLNPAGATTQLEKFEGMRMHADALRSVGPTNEFGETFTVLEGVARPLREPGIEISQPIPPDPTSGVPDCCIPQWDLNPERIMIDWDGLAGSTVINVTSNVAITNVTGPLDFTFSNYKILPEPTPTVGANISAVPVPTPVAGEFTVAGFNIENFTGAETQKKKAALAIRTVLHYPDVIGHVEIASLAALQALATQVNNDAVAAGDPDPMYTAHLIPFTGTQHLGFLVKTSRVQVDSVTQERTGDTFINPNTGLPETLHDRPPLVLRATFDPSSDSPREVIVVVNHLRSFIDIELVGGEGPRVRAKRKAQGEAIAELLQDLQTDNPSLPVISIGDYNAYQFNDGYTDLIATIKGSPTADDQVVVDASPDVVDPNYINLTDGLPADQRYSFIFEGTPQALDHVIVNTVANSYVSRYFVARNNADFPEAAVFTGDVNRPERNSDHDMPIAYFNFPPTITLTTGTINLSPPNHLYRTINMSDLVATAGDAGDPSIDTEDLVITHVTSDEVENAPGSTDGNTLDDIVIAANCKSVQLRAERDGALNGRVYTVYLKVTDASGKTATATRLVTVRLSPGAGNAIDSGPAYTVNSVCP